VFIHHSEVHEQMLRHLFNFEIPTLDVELGLVAHRLQQSVDKAARPEAVRNVDSRDELFRKFRQRHQSRTRTLMQALHERHHLVLEHPRNQPFAALVADLVQRVDRHTHRHAILHVARLVQIGR